MLLHNRGARTRLNPLTARSMASVRGKVQDYLQDKAMDALLRNTIIYNVAWEVRALRRAPSSPRMNSHKSP